MKWTLIMKSITEDLMKATTWRLLKEDAINRRNNIAIDHSLNAQSTGLSIQYILYYYIY